MEEGRGAGGGGGGYHNELEEEHIHREHLAMHKEVIQNMRHQPWDLGRKLRVLRRAKLFVRQHEGALQQRLAQSRTAKDVFARGRQLATKANITLRLRIWQNSPYFVE